MFAFTQLISVHGKAHGTTRLTPLQTSVSEYFIQSFLFRLQLDQPGARYDQCLLDISRNLASLNDRRSGS